jgi:biopolymer transport protein ExbD
MAGFSSNRPNAPITGINVTPLVDITLVLLIIFMLTAKLVVSRAMPLDLPAAASGSEIQEVFSLSLTAVGATLVDGREIADSRELLELSRAARQRNAELRAVLRADGRVPHERVLHAMDVLRQAGVSHIAFAVTPGPAVDQTAAAKPAAGPAPQR